MGEQRLRPLTVRPGARVNELAQILDRSSREVPIAIEPADLPRMSVRSRNPLGVPLDHRRIIDSELCRQIFHHGPRNIQRIRQERPQEPHCPNLKRKTEPIMLTATLSNPFQVSRVEIEELLQLRRRWFAYEPPEHHRLFLGQILISRHITTLPRARAGLSAQFVPITTKTPT